MFPFGSSKYHFSLKNYSSGFAFYICPYFTHIVEIAHLEPDAKQPKDKHTDAHECKCKIVFPDFQQEKRRYKNKGAKGQDQQWAALVEQAHF